MYIYYIPYIYNPRSKKSGGLPLHGGDITPLGEESSSGRALDFPDPPSVSWTYVRVVRLRCRMLINVTIHE